MHHGSLSVSQFRTRSPNRSAEDRGVLGEAGDDVAVRPAARVLERLRQVPVEEGEPRLDPPLEQPVDEPVVELQALEVRRTGAGGLDAWPGDAEPIRPEAQRGHEVEVLVETVEVVAGDVAGPTVLGHARRVRVRVPDARSAAVDIDGALDLVRGGGGSPGEARGEPIDQPPWGDGAGWWTSSGAYEEPEPAMATSARDSPASRAVIVTPSQQANQAWMASSATRSAADAVASRSSPRATAMAWSTQTPSST